MSADHLKPVASAFARTRCSYIEHEWPEWPKEGFNSLWANLLSLLVGN